MTQLGFYFNQQQCIGCRTCQISCKDRFDLKVGQSFRRVSTFETGKYPNPGYYHLASTCNHCASPACVANCPTGAMAKDLDTGIVTHDDDACIGCQTCVRSCPYEVPVYLEERNIVGKCTACAEERAENNQPVCVAACPMRALEFGDMEELKAAHPGAVSKIAVLPDSETGPSTLIEAKDCATEADFVQRFI